MTRLRKVRVLLGFTRVDAPDPDADEQPNVVALSKGNFYEKINIRKKITEKSKALEKLQESFHEKGTGFKAEGEREIAAFEKQFEINPILLVNIVLKF